MKCFTTSKATIAIEVVSKSNLKKWLSAQPENVLNQLTTVDFKATDHDSVNLFNEKGELSKVVVGVENIDIYSLAALPLKLPKGNYHIEDEAGLFGDTDVEIGWALGAYQFDKYKKMKRQPAKLKIRDNADYIKTVTEGCYYTRDLINTSPEQMGPEELAASAEALAEEFSADCNVIVGEELLEQNFPAIHAVGRASDREPRLIDLRWGTEGKKITLVGKGVCFDTGGLDIKPPAGMIMMSKDMGGAAHVLGLARMIMTANIPVQLRVLVSAVENSISGNAYRPSDVINTRKGLTVEIGNTDAEGRVVLADAITYALEEEPDVLIDMATLTGAARAAVGTEIAALFSNSPELTELTMEYGDLLDDPIWPLPLYKGYRHLLDSPYADINNASKEPYGGAITAALFLKEFVGDDTPWMHFDIMAATTQAKPGRPIGAESMAIRALFEMLLD
tara:strand:- start:14982 stop:16328 length:1347 start_codon:yes stop_codon:yes gene_type:complete